MNQINQKQMRSFSMLPNILFLAILLVVISSCADDDKQTVVNFTKLVMADEFDTEGAPNPAMWNYDTGRGPGDDGWGNQELQYYTDRTENVKVENGFLLITAQEESFEGASYTS